MNQIEVEYVLELKKELHNINKKDLSKVDIIYKGEKVNISKKQLEEHSFSGLTNVDFITMNFWEVEDD